MMVLLFGSMALFFLCAERFFAQRKQPLLREGFFTDAAYAPLYVLMRIAINGTVAFSAVNLVRPWLPEGFKNSLSQEPLWLQSIVLLLSLDFLFYCTHRLKHRWSWWWRLHETHHSGENVDFMSSTRFHPLEKLLDRSVYILPLAWIGPSQEALLIWACTEAFFGMFAHSNLRWKIGPLKYIFMNPEMHRWHHVRDTRIAHCNFGNNFSIFDWVFGTAYLSKEIPEDFGLREVSYPHGSLIGQFLYAFRKKGSDGSRLVVDTPFGETIAVPCHQRPFREPESIRPRELKALELVARN